MIDFYENTYYINIDEVFKLVSYSDRVERKETEITDGYQYDSDENRLVPLNKMVREIKSPTDSQIDNIRYDFIKFLIEKILDLDFESIKSGSYGAEICLNSLLKKGILVKIKKDDDNK